MPNSQTVNFMVLFLEMMVQLFHHAYHEQTIGGIFHTVKTAICVFSGHYPSAKKKKRTLGQSCSQSVLSLNVTLIWIKINKKNLHCQGHEVHSSMSIKKNCEDLLKSNHRYQSTSQRVRRPGLQTCCDISQLHKVGPVLSLWGPLFPHLCISRQKEVIFQDFSHF